MNMIKKKARCALPCQAVYEVVNDIDRYHYFLKGCRNSETLSIDGHEKTARLTLGKGLIQHSFVTRNVLQKNKSMRLSLVEGPFQYFDGLWRFDALDSGGCVVHFELDFAFSNPLIGMAAKQLIYSVADHIVDAFIERAEVLHGKEG